MFRVGMKVSCISDDFSGYSNPPKNLPHQDKVYTLRSSFSADGLTWWRLVEIVNEPSLVEGGKYGLIEPAFAPWRFRPIVERKTNIEFAHEILRKATKQQPVGVG